MNNCQTKDFIIYRNNMMQEYEKTEREKKREFFFKLRKRFNANGSHAMKFIQYSQADRATHTQIERKQKIAGQ